VSAALAAWVESVVRAEWAGSEAPVGLVVSAAPEVLAGLVALVVWVGSEALAEWAELVARGALEEQIARRPCRLAAATSGSTIRNIAGALPIGIVRLPTGLGARLAAIRFPNARRAPASRLAGRVAIWPAVAAEPVQATGPPAEV